MRQKFNIINITTIHNKIKLVDTKHRPPRKTNFTLKQRRYCIKTNVKYQEINKIVLIDKNHEKAANFSSML